MPIDAYALCPGGKDKKVKFCCGDLVGELEKIGRMLDGDQRQGCLEHVERLMKKHTGRACLITVKANLERQLGRTTDAEKTLQELLAGEPDNPVALAEAATLAIREQGTAAGMGPLQKALEAADGKFPPNLREALVSMFSALTSEGKLLAARHYLILYLQATKGEDKSALESLVRLDGMSAPLLNKLNLSLSHCPAGAEFQAEFDEVRNRGARGAFGFAAERFARLAERYPGVPEIVRNVAVAKTIIADYPAAAAAWRQYAQMNLPLDEAVEAEALAQSLDPAAVTDRYEMLAVSMPIVKMDDCVARLSSDRRFQTVPVDGFSEADGEPPPRNGFAILDRPMPESAAGMTLEAAPRILGQAWLFGKQTDREARLELVAWRGDKQTHCRRILSEAAGDALADSAEEKVITSAGLQGYLSGDRLFLPRDATPEQHVELELACLRRARLEEVGRLPLKLFGGRTAEQAAADPACRVPLLAFVLAQESAANMSSEVLDYNQLRSRLGLPAGEPLLVSRDEIGKLPLTRLARLDVARMDDETLLRAYSKAVAIYAVEALRRSAWEVISRPSLDQQIDKAEAYSLLLEISHDPRRSLEYVEKGREAAVRQGQSSASWDLEEAKLCAQIGEADRFSRMIEHVFAEHMNEPGVRQEVQQLFYQLGLIDEQGQPLVSRGAAAPAEAGLVGAGSPAAEPGQLWTPESERPQKSALWLPGME